MCEAAIPEDESLLAGRWRSHTPCKWQPEESEGIDGGGAALKSNHTIPKPCQTISRSSIILKNDINSMIVLLQ